jgi:hypothetical protein
MHPQGRGKRGIEQERGDDQQRADNQGQEGGGAIADIVAARIEAARRAAFAKIRRALERQSGGCPF